MKKSKKAEEKDPSPMTKKPVEYTVRIGNHLYQRINKHMRLLKNLKNETSKQKWIKEAISEKLKVDETSDENLGDRFLHLKFEIELWHEVQKKIEILKTFYTSISKKQWIEEAIYEKLDREEQDSKDLLKDMIKKASEVQNSASK